MISLCIIAYLKKKSIKICFDFRLLLILGESGGENMDISEFFEGQTNAKSKTS